MSYTVEREQRLSRGQTAELMRTSPQHLQCWDHHLTDACAAVMPMFDFQQDRYCQWISQFGRPPTFDWFSL